MFKVISCALGILVSAVIVYLFFTGNTASAVILFIGAAAFGPLLTKIIKGELYLGSASYNTSKGVNDMTSSGPMAYSATSNSSGDCGGDGGC
ncbi:hypothetical protein LRP49_06600 [Enterovibrio sp. ZSDZ35]|uniref:Uncharacterized protein n=1 Tax=Enterovibrio qingdaonensis TaxID=2899818 RepID=A0ABT5QJT4_9GAMM|nr:hypothetical protein [Enterovibrio sp. ZSDZ35]MDD1780869.1 hypothetical protein [Enterovibrio sp. ZSDZ35]